MSAVVVLGAGHDGLAAAALLARAGRDVTVVEPCDVLGAECGREEVHPGFHTAGAAHASTPAPALLAALPELESRLELRVPPATLVLDARDPEAPGLLVGGSDDDARRELAQVAPDDVEAFERWRALLGRVRPIAESLAGAPPPPIDPRGWRELTSLARQLLPLRRLSEADFHALVRIAPAPVQDVVVERFAHPLLRVGVAAPALVGAPRGPRAPGTGCNLLLAELAGPREVAGGAAALTDALLELAEQAGARLLRGRGVEAILLEDGAVAGVRLTGGETLEARQVVSALHPRRTLDELLPWGAVPRKTARDVAHLRTAGCTAVATFALDSAPEFRARPGQRVERALLAGDLDDLERASDSLKYGRAVLDAAGPGRPWIELRVTTWAGSRSAPEGQHLISAHLHGVPYATGSDGGADVERALGELAFAALEPHVADLRARTLRLELRGPGSLEERFGLPGGHLGHGDVELDQLGPLRPTADWSRSAGPVGGLLLAGPGVHPGPHARGASGVLAARAALRDG